MKKERKNREHYTAIYKDLLDKYDLNEDYRYWGVFPAKDNKPIAIDPKRFKEKIGLTDEQFKVMSKRNSHYFYPRKSSYGDYNCNVFIYELENIKKNWNEQYSKLIQREVETLKKPREVSPGDNENFMSGISGYGSAQMWALFTNIQSQNEYKSKLFELGNSLYAQFFHLMASRCEAVIIKVLAKNNVNVDHFDRNVFYTTAINMDRKIQELEHFRYLDMLYCLWNYIKHNSSSTYETLRSRYPHLLYEYKYEQGELAQNYVRFSNELVDELIDGCSLFFKEYCKLIFDEDYDEAQWNYEFYFERKVRDSIEDITNPSGLQWWDDID